MAAKEDRNIFIGPDEGAYLPTLDIAHKVPSESFGGALTIIERGLSRRVDTSAYPQPRA